MIQMPRRSVTRFFIPLIDVLILLFCIFLLMPLVKEAPARPDEPHSGSHEVEGDRTGSEASLEALRAELEQLRQAKRQVLQERLAVRVLEIDPTNGKLYYHDPERVEVSNDAEAAALIQRDGRAIGESGRELYYEILYPRDPASPYPLREQRRKYDEWFKDVAHGWDIPGGSLKGGKP
jgi:hypothetical protein